MDRFASAMVELYPLKFKTIYKEKIWGGGKIHSVLGKVKPEHKDCGETWEISALPDEMSIVDDGYLAGQTLGALVEKYGAELMGEKVFKKFPNRFPLLIKFLDANRDLSIQVHPNDELAMLRHKGSGKTEMWYILQADEDATVVSGFNKKMTKSEFIESAKSGTIEELLNRQKVKAGDVVFMPAGRVHTIGKGILAAEIQQASDITYRIFDFNRTNDDGDKRELHIDMAADAINYDDDNNSIVNYNNVLNEAIPLVESEYFITRKLWLNQNIDRDYSIIDSFVILVSVSGQGSFIYNDQRITVSNGDVYLLPANIKSIKLEPQSTEWSLLEVTL